MKSGSASAVGFGRVLQAVRKRSYMNQADVAAFFDPKLSVAAVSMAESGNRAPKTEALVRRYADALDLDGDALLELWWAMQGVVEIEDWTNGHRPRRIWWRDLPAEAQAEVDYHQAQSKAAAEWTPNEDFYPPSQELFVFAEAICSILRSLLGDTWKVSHKAEMGLREYDGRLAAVAIELRAAQPEDATAAGDPGLLTTFACPEPVTQPDLQDTTTRPGNETLPRDIAWFLSSIEAMPARERAAVAGFIRGIREGANLFSGTSDAAR